MINIKMIGNTDVIDNLTKRGYQIPNELEVLLKEEKALKVIIQTTNEKLNNKIKVDKDILKETKTKLAEIEIKIKLIIDLIPNLLHETVPFGKGEQDNILITEFFNEKKKINKFNHADIGKKIGLDIETGVALAHTRFNTMHGQVAKLHRKLTNLALDFYTTLGYEEYYVPNLVNEETMFGTGQYPKFKEELFVTEGNNKLFLVPTGEVPLTNIVKNKILKEDEVEKKLMTHTPCFRKEVGAYGKDTKGIIRQHQFEKIELVRTCLPENGLKNFEEMVNNINDFIKQFNIPYRIIELCAGDIGFAGHKAYDFEIWFPAEGKYREIATVTWCHDFQARRMKTKVRRLTGEKELIHTLNGTGLAVGRVLAAIIENNYENEELIIPVCLL
jgi:seryl-tRNA synthetase